MSEHQEHQSTAVPEGAAVTESPQTSPVAAAPSRQKARKYGWFVLAFWQVDGGEQMQAFRFDSKREMMREIRQPKFGNVNFRIIRGYELDVRKEERVIASVTVS